MDTAPITLLKTWVESLDHQIGDTDAEIAKRREQNDAAVRMRDEVLALVVYLESHELPAPVLRALTYCLSWNPWAKRSGVGG